MTYRRYPRYKSFNGDRIMNLVAQMQRAARRAEEYEDEIEQARRRVGLDEDAPEECDCNGANHDACPVCTPEIKDEELPY